VATTSSTAPTPVHAVTRNTMAVYCTFMALWDHSGAPWAVAGMHRGSGEAWPTRRDGSPGVLLAVGEKVPVGVGTQTFAGVVAKALRGAATDRLTSGQQSTEA